jgi:hypothetical protein
VPPERAAAAREADVKPDATDADILRAEPELQSLPQALLMPFDATGQTPWGIPFAFEDYLELVDWTGRALLPEKRGHIAANRPKILDRLGIDGTRFLLYADSLLKEFGTAVGASQALVNLCARRQAKYLRGIRTAQRLFAAGSVPKVEISFKSDILPK